MNIENNYDLEINKFYQNALQNNIFLRENYSFRITNDSSNNICEEQQIYDHFCGNFDNIKNPDSESNSINNEEPYQNIMNLEKNEDVNKTNNISSKNRNNNPILNNELIEPKFKVEHNAWNIDNFIKVDYLAYITLVFILFNSKKISGRKPNCYKAINPNSRHGADSYDNLKQKVFRTCFKVISNVIFNLCKGFGDKYKIQKLNKSEKTNNTKDKKKYCSKLMEEILINNELRNKRSHGYNKNKYDKIVRDGLLEKSVLLKTILKMTYGEILLKFLNDDNFVEEIDHDNHDFSTYSFHFKNYPKEDLIKDFKKNILSN